MSDSGIRHLENGRHDALSCFAGTIRATYANEDRLYPYDGSSGYCRILIERAAHYYKPAAGKRTWRPPAVYSELAEQKTLTGLSGLQLKIFADDITQYPSVQIAAAIDFFGNTGGDFYTIYNLPGKRIGVIIADVCGKDRHAAAYVPAIQRVFYHEIIRGHSAGQMLTMLNNSLHQILPDDRFVTVFLGIYDTLSRSLEFANAGHPAGMLIQPGGRKITLDSTGPGLGMAPDIRFGTGKISISPADILVLYTDGYSFDTTLVKSIMERGIVQTIIKKDRYCSANEIVRIFRTHRQNYMRPEYINDDRTIVTLQFFGAGKGAGYRRRRAQCG